MSNFFGRVSILSLLCLQLTGCFNKDDKIVDIAAGVFILYGILIILKYTAPYLMKTTFVNSLRSSLVQHINHISLFLLSMASILFFYGSLSGGIDRVLIFVGFTLFVITYHYRSWCRETNGQKQRLYIEVIISGIGFLLVLTILWSLGFDMFKQI